jgi:hypothetical protein
MNIYFVDLFYYFYICLISDNRLRYKYKYQMPFFSTITAHSLLIPRQRSDILPVKETALPARSSKSSTCQEQLMLALRQCIAFKIYLREVVPFPGASAIIWHFLQSWESFRMRLFESSFLIFSSVEIRTSFWTGLMK